MENFALLKKLEDLDKVGALDKLQILNDSGILDKLIGAKPNPQNQPHIPSVAALPSVQSTFKSYKSPDLSFINSEFMLNMFRKYETSLPYMLAEYVYFQSGLDANKTITAPHKTLTHPRTLEVIDCGDAKKLKTTDVLLDVHKIMCGLINTHLTKGEIYVRMEMADKKLLADMACGRFTAKLSPELIKSYIDAITP